MLQPTHIAETALYVDDIERAVAFYTELFECAVLRRDERFCALRIAKEEVLLLFKRGGSLEAHRVPGGLIPAHDGVGPLHVCFGINEDELEAWWERLREKRIAIESGLSGRPERSASTSAIRINTPWSWRHRGYGVDDFWPARF